MRNVPNSKLRSLCKTGQLLRVKGQAVNDVTYFELNCLPATTPHKKVQRLSFVPLFLSPGCKWKLHIEVLVASLKAISNHKTPALVLSVFA